MSWPTPEHLDTLREQVHEQEQELHEALEELEGVARRVFDARGWIRSRPLVWVCGAFVVGALLGARSRALREGARG